MRTRLPHRPAGRLAAGFVAAAVVAAGLACACTGPSMHVDNPAGHSFFVDGQRDERTEQPFRYYGQSRVDALPADVNGAPDWALQPASQVVAVPAPASPWLFPLDLPIELVRRLLTGREDGAVVIALPPTPPELRVEPEIRPTGIEAVGERALQARIAR